MPVFFSKFVTRVPGCSTEGLEGPLTGASEDRLGSWAPAPRRGPRLPQRLGPLPALLRSSAPSLSHQIHVFLTARSVLLAAALVGEGPLSVSFPLRQCRAQAALRRVCEDG